MTDEKKTEDYGARMFMLGAGAVLAGMAADRIFRALSWENLRGAVYVASEARSLWNPTPPRVVAEEIPEMDNGDMPVRRPVMRGEETGLTVPPPSAESWLDQIPPMPGRGAVPVDPHEAGMGLFDELLERANNGQDLTNVSWQEL